MAKAPNWEVLHYVRRPAKNIERKLIAELLARLEPLRALDSFHYIGLGSIYFVDFALFHKRLGIRRMTNIEWTDDEPSRRRLTFNKPFRFVDLRFGHSNARLPELDWAQPAIVWMDYVGRIGTEAFEDVDTVISKATPPFVLLMTFNVKSGDAVRRLERFVDDVGQHRVPPGFESNAALAGGKTADATARVFDNEVRERLAARNAGLDDADKLVYRQLLDFRYADGHDMMTIGGVVHAAAQTDSFAACRFPSLPYYVADGAPAYTISVPNLTIRETLFLDQRLTKTGVPKVAAIGLSVEDAEEYRRAYLHFPSFVDVEIR